MVEFAIGVTMLATVFAGTFSYGYTFYRYNTLLAAVNAGARYASLRPYDSTSTTPTTAFQTAVANMVVYNDPAPATGTSPVVPGLATSHVNLAVTFTDGVPTAMTVSLTGFSFTTIFGTTTLNGKPLARYAFQGLYAPAGSF